MSTDAHKNKARAPLRPFDGPTAALSVLGLGFLRPAPGTWGSMPPCALVGLALIGGASYWAIQGMVLTVLFASCALCVRFGVYGERRFGRKDAAEVVIDETAGVCFPLLLWPASFVASCVPTDWTMDGVWPALVRAGVAVGAAFVLFRVFDILKPWPARRLESLPHGWGVLADDLMAGVYAGVAMQIVLRVFIAA